MEPMERLAARRLVDHHFQAYLAYRRTYRPPSLLLLTASYQENQSGKCILVDNTLTLVFIDIKRSVLGGALERLTWLAVWERKTIGNNARAMP